MMRARPLGPVLLALVLAGCGGACRSRPAVTPAAQLDTLWTAYRNRHITADGAVVDPRRQGHVTSEAQSYALVRAVWMGDRATFRRVIAWTEVHLARPDGLHAWLWDPVTGRVLDPNTATDGDLDIAYALAMASVAFDHPPYAEQARRLIRAIRTRASITTTAGWFPSAGNWAQDERVINLSYFYPYAVPWFEQLDPGVGWDETKALGYDLVKQALDAGPDALPADFNILTADGILQPLPAQHPLSRVFSYDAMRIGWRLELACGSLRDSRACQLSEALAQRMRTRFERDHRLVTQYSPAGTALNDEQSTSFYAAFLPAFTRMAPAVARDWRATHLSPDALEAMMRADDRYYDANWTWFGLAAADGMLQARTPSIERFR
jgi:endo-1,4-beta-D-glucanase Y